VSLLIRKCNNSDYQKIVNFISKEPAFNLFIIADIERYGVSTDFIDLWGDFYDDKLNAVLLRYHANYVVYSDIEDYDINGFIDIMESQKEFKVLSGKKEIIDLYKNRIHFSKTRDTYFLKLEEKNFNPSFIKKNTVKIEKATADDAQDLFELSKKIKEFEIPNSVEDIRKRLEDKFGRTYVIRKDNKVVSAASTTAECSFSAMIGGVMTDPSFRKKGYASICIVELCKELLGENKTACLFYDNPSAGSIYRRIGFKDVGSWGMCVR